MRQCCQGFNCRDGCAVGVILRSHSWKPQPCHTASKHSSTTHPAPFPAPQATCLCSCQLPLCFLHEWKATLFFSSSVQFLFRELKGYCPEFWKSFDHSHSLCKTYWNATTPVTPAWAPVQGKWALLRAAWPCASAAVVRRGDWLHLLQCSPVFSLHPRLCGHAWLVSITLMTRWNVSIPLRFGDLYSPPSNCASS